MKDRDRTIRITVSILCAVILTAVCITDCERVMLLAAQLAVKSAGTFLPQTVELTQEKIVSEPESSESEKASETTEKQTQTEQKETAPVFKSKSSLTDTDSDIKELMKLEEAVKYEKAGALKDKTYKNEGVTDTVGNVRIKNTNKTQIDAASLLNKKADLTVDKDEPSVLIFHTHTTETYQIAEREHYATDFAPRSESEKVNMIRVGRAIAEQIEKAGYKVIHDKTIYDSKYSGAYACSRKGAEAILEKYPSIKIVLDIHRDAIQLKDGTKIRPVAAVNGKQAAQIMIISGCQEEGNGITNLPDWEYNLIFALQLQKKLEDNFEGITRPLYFCARSYNMNLTHCSLLVEMGSDANTLEQAVYSGKCLGVAVGKLLEEYD